MSSYKLTYFHARGVAEVSRLIFAYAGQPYEDNRIEHKDWPAQKPNTPFGQIPVLEVDGVKIAQSNAIARFLARRFGLAGQDDIEAAKVDMIVDYVQDLVTCLVDIYLTGKEDTTKAKEKLAEIRKTFTEDTLPGHLEKLETLLCSNNEGNGFLVGDGLTFADLAVQQVTTWMPPLKIETPWDKAPKIRALVERVEGLPKIAEWIEKRPQTFV